MPKSEVNMTKGLGARYGATVRKRASKALALLRQKRICPSCGSKRFKRKAAGIWFCKKCNYTVAGGAYDL